MMNIEEKVIETLLMKLDFGHCMRSERYDYFRVLQSTQYYR